MASSASVLPGRVVQAGLCDGHWDLGDLGVHALKQGAAGVVAEGAQRDAIRVGAARRCG